MPAGELDRRLTLRRRFSVYRGSGISMSVRLFGVLACLLMAAAPARAQVWSYYGDRDDSGIQYVLVENPAKGTKAHSLECSFASKDKVTIEIPSGRTDVGHDAALTITNGGPTIPASGMIWIARAGDKYAWRITVDREQLERLTTYKNKLIVIGNGFQHEIPTEAYGANVKSFAEACAKLKEAKDSHRKALPVNVSGYAYVPQRTASPASAPAQSALTPAEIADAAQKMATEQPRPAMSPAEIDAAAKKLAADALASLNATAVIDPAANTSSVLNICNRSSKTLWLFYASPIDEDGDKWRVQGWFEAKPRKCNDIIVPKGLIQYYAYSDTREWKGKDGFYCLAYRITDKIAFPKEKCVTGERRLGAVELLIEGNNVLLELKP